MTQVASAWTGCRASFVNPAMIAGMKAYLGVAPVSAGGDHTGARIDVRTAPPAFAPGPDLVTTVLLSGIPWSR